MSATNSTSHYQLSQFIGTDVPGWLSDYNSDNAKIDTGIFNAQSAAEAAGTTATQAANDIQTINGTLTTQAAQISAAAQSASQAQTSAGQAMDTAQQADGKADANTTAIAGLDTRVSALESGGGQTALTTHDITVDHSLTVSFGSSYSTNAIQLTYPAGKTIADLVSLIFISTTIGANVIMEQTGSGVELYLVRPTSAANVKGYIRCLFK